MADEADRRRDHRTGAASAATGASDVDPTDTVPDQRIAKSGPAADDSRLEPLRRRRHTLVVVLTLLTGCADATGFLALGGAFSSVMTGNIVLLGLSAGHAEAALAINSGAAIISYIVGVLLGAHLAGTAESSDPVWPRQVTRALTMELVILLVLLLMWEMTMGHRSHTEARALLMLSAAALGTQGSAVQRFGVPGLSSTYLTGTLTTLVGAVAARKPRHTMLPSAQVLLALMAGAAVGALVVDQAPRFSPILLIMPLLSVLVASRNLQGRPRPTGNVDGGKAASTSPI